MPEGVQVMVRKVSREIGSREASGGRGSDSSHRESAGERQRREDHPILSSPTPVSRIGQSSMPYESNIIRAQPRTPKK